MLGDAAGLAGDHVGLADAVEQQRLAVVDVAHDGDDRRPRPQQLLVLLVVVVEVLGLELGFLLLAGVDQADGGAISAANSSIMSSLSDMVAVTISPCCSRKRTTSAAERLSLGPTSWAVEPRSMMTSPSGTAASDGL